MSAQPGTPAWYLEGGEDCFTGHVDTDAAKAVVEEARRLLFQDLSPDLVRKAIKARGARHRTEPIVARASMLEWKAVVGAASTDVEAGQTNTKHIATVRRLALEIIKEDPTGATFAQKLTARGASDGLAAYLASDPAVTKAGRLTGWLLLAGGLAGLVVSCGVILMRVVVDEGPPAQIWAILAFSAGGVFTGLTSLLRRPG